MLSIWETMDARCADLGSQIERCREKLKLPIYMHRVKETSEEYLPPREWSKIAQIEDQVCRYKCELKICNKNNRFDLASATCLQKTGSETGFLAQNLDRLLDRDFQSRISDRKAEQVFKTETGF